MKKVFLLYLCIIIGFCCWSCKNTKKEPENTSQDTVLESTSEPDLMEDSITQIRFEDLNQFLKFIKSANGSASDFKDYVESTDPTFPSIISHEEAEWIADRICGHTVIVPDVELEEENIRYMKYTVEYDCFMISFQKNNTLCHFWYYYSQDYLTSPYSHYRPVKNITIGSYNIQLYQSEYNEDDYICGFLHENIFVEVRVISSNLNEISFENFHFEYLE